MIADEESSSSLCQTIILEDINIEECYKDFNPENLVDTVLMLN
ncbi:39852_t:CDS:2 [Gigaspora margarita]|uniref:39852_t:CDS:1 n=1 Tax=Gigaspora margarita TaxID=4874 RepID=A0ABN7USW6_GIGMA|nr:39852_t:CDS:2 [Gigaspora margarita]